MMTHFDKSLISYTVMELLKIQGIYVLDSLFDSIPQERWKIKDPVFIKQSEEFAITI
jgi:hypothetical protein